MSCNDEIIINQNTTQNSVFVNELSANQSIEIIAGGGSLVLSVNGQIGNVIITPSSIGLGNVDNTSDLNKPLSYATISALLLKTDLSAFNALNNLVTSQYLSWENVYFTVNTLSGNWNNSYNWVNNNSSNAIFNTISASSLSGVFYGDGSHLIGASLPNQVTINSIVSSNSANWNSSYNTVLNLSANWNSISFLQTLSTNDQSVYAQVNTLSSNWNSGSGFQSQSANNASVYSNVNSNSANWNSISFLQALSANDKSVYSTFNAQSANNASVYNQVNSLSSGWGNGGSSISASVSGNWQSTYATVSSLSSTWSSISFLQVLSANDQSVFSNVNSNSANWSSISFLQVASANNASVYSNVNSNSANWNSISFLQALSANDKSVYSTFNAQSANNASVYTNVNSNSANWSSISFLQSASANNASVYTNVNSNSANWSSISFLQSASANNASVYTYVNQNTSNWNNAYNNAIYTINGTSNQITVTPAGNNTGNNSATISLPNTVNITTLNVLSTLNVTGSANFYNTNYFAVSDNIIYFGEGNTGNTLDLGLVSHFVGNLNNGQNKYQHTGLVRQAGQNSPAVWTLFSGLTSEPESTPSGINWSDPYLQMDSLSANIYAAGGNSNQWSSTYTAFNTQSANNVSVYSSVNSNSANWNSISFLQSASANNSSVYSTFNAQSANNASVYSSVNSNSANWSSISFLQSASANNTSVFSSFNTQSANNASVYSTFNIQSANNASVYSSVNTNSANWSSISFLQSASANNISVYSSFNTQSANNVSVYSSFNTQSANNASVYSTFNIQSANNASVYSSYNQNSSYITTTSNITATIAAGNIAIGNVINAGTTLQQFITNLITTIYYPTSSAPSTSLSLSSPFNTSTVEAGTSATSITFTDTLNQGNVAGKLVGGFWQAGTSQGTLVGSPSAYYFMGVNVGSTNPYVSSANVIIADGANTFNTTVYYNSGSQFYNSVNQPWNQPYPAGSVNGSTTVTGYRKAFYGTNITNVASPTASDVRALAGSVLNPNNSTNFSVNVVAGTTTNVAFAYPTSYISNTPQAINSGTGYNDINAFNKSTILVGGANNYNPVSTTVYILTGVFTTNYSYSITL